MTDLSASRPPRRLRWTCALACLLIGLWALRFLAGGELAPGNDITGHLQRSAFGLREVFLEGRLDAWYPGSMLGYQLFLFYGPGLTILIGLIELLSAGLVSDAGAIKAVLVAAYLVMPYVTSRFARALGLGSITALAAGVLALAAGSTRGGGIDGSFATGLAAQQVGVPLVMLALAMIVEHVNHGATSRPAAGPLPLAVAVAALALTHPLSLLVLAMLTPLALVAVWIRGTFDASGWRTLVIAAGWTTALSAWWWLPAALHQDLRGPVTSFTLPGVREHLELLFEGRRGWRGVIGVVSAAGVGITLAVGIVRRSREMAALALLPVSTFVVLHASHGLLGVYSDVGRQLPNRGLVFVALLAAPATAAGVETLVRVVALLAGRRPHVLAVRSATFAVLAAVAFWSVTALEIGPVDRYRPVEEMHDAATILADGVPDSARYAWIDGRSNDLGVPEPQRWLAWKADRNSLTPFGPEYAPGSGTVSVASNGPSPEGVDKWIDDVRLLGASHIATGNEEKAALLDGNERLTPLLDTESLVVWRIEPAPGAPVGSLVITGESEVVDQDVNRYVVDVRRSTPGPAEMALGYSPGWDATVDGEPTATAASVFGRLEVELPAGDHTVELRFHEPASGPIGRSITFVGIVLALAWTLRQRRRSTRSEPVAETASKSPETARR